MQVEKLLSCVIYVGVPGAVVYVLFEGEDQCGKNVCLWISLSSWRSSVVTCELETAAGTGLERLCKQVVSNGFMAELSLLLMNEFK